MVEQHGHGPALLWLIVGDSAFCPPGPVRRNSEHSLLNFQKNVILVPTNNRPVSLIDISAHMNAAILYYILSYCASQSIVPHEEYVG